MSGKSKKPKVKPATQKKVDADDDWDAILAEEAAANRVITSSTEEVSKVNNIEEKTELVSVAEKVRRCCYVIVINVK
jgi:hypothetical protein